MNVTLRPYQQDDVAYMYHKAKAAGGLRLMNLNDTGLGKTIEAISVIHYLSLTSDYCLIIAPKSMKYEWAGTFKKILGIQPLVLDKDFNTRQEQLDWVVGRRVIVIATYGTVRRHAEFFISNPPEFLVADEAHRLTNPRAEITRIVAKMMRGVTHFLPMTATPIEKNPAQFWALLHMLNPQEFPSYWKFERRYCRYVSVGGYKKFYGTQNAQELQNILKRYCIRRSKASVLTDLPPLTEKVVYLDLDAKQRAEQVRVYTELKKFNSSHIGDRLLITKNAGSLLTRLRQVCISPALLGGADHSPKYDYVIEAIEAESSPLCVFSPFSLEPLLQRLDAKCITYVVIDGDTSARARSEAIARLNAGEVRVCLYTQAGGEGITLVGSHRLIILAEDWSTRVMKQVRDRLHRIGQLNPVLVEYLILRGTVEEYVHNLLAQKTIWTQQSMVEHIAYHLEELQEAA